MQLVWQVLEKESGVGWTGQDSEQVVVTSCKLSMGHSDVMQVSVLSECAIFVFSSLELGFGLPSR